MDTISAHAQLPVPTPTRDRQVTPRRHRTIEEKLAILAEAAAPGASVAAVARRHELNTNVLFGWRRLQAKGLLERHTRPLKSRRRLIPVRVVERSAASGSVRLEFPSGIVLEMSGAADAGLIERLITLLRR
jgi:transposase